MKLRRITVASGILGCAALGGWAFGGIEGSKHDFSNQAWSGGDRCAACHTPASEKQPAAPLWDANADPARTFGTSLAKSKNAGLGTMVCLRCHDGTIARDTFPTASRKSRFVSLEHPGLFQSGHDTSNHPVGVPYPSFDQGFRPAPSVVASGTVTLPKGNVECISCHDPHNMSGVKHLLVRSNARSALCLTCHRK